ncbi:50S ribosomal protein L20 [Capsicum annuum]
MNKKEVFKLAKGFRGRAKNCIRIARERVEKALQYSYRDRRNKKRDMRSLWIQRINAGTRQHGVNYGNFMHGLMKENVQLNRKVLSELSMHEPYSFKALVDVSLSAFPGPFYRSSKQQASTTSSGSKINSRTAWLRKATNSCNLASQQSCHLQLLVHYLL